MNCFDELLDRFTHSAEHVAIVWNARAVSYANLLQEVETIEERLISLQIRATVVSVSADFSPVSIALLIALWRQANTVAVMTSPTDAKKTSLIQLCQPQWTAEVSSCDQVEFNHTDYLVTDPLLKKLCDHEDPGLIIFSSGSTGKPKASVHRARLLVSKHIARKHCLTTIAFLLFDHIGGLNTLFYVLFNGGKLVIPTSRQPYPVAMAIKTHKVQAITTSPTFINLLILSGAMHAYDLTSLEVINYSTEPMPDSTLEQLHKLLPSTRLSQAYGLTETGVIPSRSEHSGSNWIILGDDQCHVRVVNNLLEVKNNTTMIGYINEPSAFTEDGYFRTGDVVVQRGPYLKVLGRQSEIINVGGEKVFPSEIENVLRNLSNVVDVLVNHEKNAIAGNLIKATFRLDKPEPLDQFKARLNHFCFGKLAPFQLPRKIALTCEPLHSERFKKNRMKVIDGVDNEC